MEKWILAMASIMLFKLALNSEVSKFCKKRMMSGGEEFFCSNATLSLFKDPNLFMNKTHKLTCNNCTLNTIEDSTFNVTKNSLNYLYLTSSRIYTLKEFAFSKFRLLKVLSLRNNTVTDLYPKSFMNLKRMAHLDLSHNNIRILINNLFEELPNLNLLNLNSNCIYYIQPDAFKGLSSLRHLYLNNNQLKKLDGFIFKYVTNLLLLYLENNQIHEIDSFAFANLASLNSLYLNNNSIRFLTQYNFKPLASLIDLQLRHNELKEIQISSFNGLANLRVLHLGNNRIKTVKRYGFVGLDSLRSLELIGNDLETFDLSFIDSMKMLNMLWLQHNKLSNFSLDYKQDPLGSLHSLGLNDNNFTEINYQLLYYKMPNIQDIFVYNNSWNCELLGDMYSFFEDKNVTLCASVDCSANKTEVFVKDCAFEEDGDVDMDFVSEVGSSVSYSFFVVLASQALFFL